MKGKKKSPDRPRSTRPAGTSKDRPLTPARPGMEPSDELRAMQEIVRVMRQSPADASPVFDAIVTSARNLLGGSSANLMVLRDGYLHLGALTSTSPEGDDALRRILPINVRDEKSLVAQVVHEAIPLTVRDVQHDPRVTARTKDAARIRGFRSIVWVPLVRADEALGVIGVTREVPGGFSQNEIELLQTFADHAVIAIDNVRLFTELQEKNRALTSSLDQQTATGDILRIIASSPTDVQPVFDAIVHSAQRLLRGHTSTIRRLVDSQLVLVAFTVMTLEGERVEGGRGPYPAARAAIAVFEGKPWIVPDVLAEPGIPFEAREQARARGYRSVLGVPLVRGEEVIGVLFVSRRDVGGFTDDEVTLLRTFADQAVIAVENARLFRELQDKNRALISALDQQTATGEILRIIASSPTDVQPVFEAIVQSAVRLLHGRSGTLSRVVGDQIELAAHTSTDSAGDAATRAAFPQSLHFAGVHARTIRERAPLNIADALTDPQLAEVTRRYAQARGYRSQIVVPMLRRDEAVGAIAVTRAEPGGFTPEELELLDTFAAQAVIAVENVRLFTELRDNNEALTRAHTQVTEALEQQTATSEILGVISRSPTHLDPVFQAIVDSAERLLGAYAATLMRVSDDQIELAAYTSTSEAGDAALRSDFPRSLDSTPSHAVCVRGRAPFNTSDAQADPRLSESAHQYARTRGYRSQLVVPMRRGDDVIGTISVTRREGGGFAPEAIALLGTFADQAVIAIENVRLFTELEAKNHALTSALDQQTATADILRVIAACPTDIQPVLDAVVARAAELCEAHDALLWLRGGDRLHVRAHHGPLPLRAEESVVAIDRGFINGRAVIDRTPVHVEDLATAADFPGGRVLALRLGLRTTLAVPLLREGDALGTIMIRRAEVRPFLPKHITVLQTFGDQAVIALENVRLFTELRENNEALTRAHAQVTEALEQQTATAEILSVISASTTNVQPVFEAIAEHAVRLLRCWSVVVWRLEGDRLHPAATRGGHEGSSQRVRELFARGEVLQGTYVGEALLNREPRQITDSEADGVSRRIREAARARGWRASLAVPIVQGITAFGVITVTRAEPGAFTRHEADLLKTFADQAVIAIENTRLLTELKERTAQLTRSVEQLTALGEVGRAVSSTLDLETVLTTIVSRAVQLAGVDGGVVFEYDEASQEFVHRAAREQGGPLAAVRRAARIRRGEGIVGQTALTLESAQIADITAPGAYESRLRDNLIASGIRGLLAVPMVSAEGKVLGSLVVSRNAPGEFSVETIDLLRTFATQSTLAIQNARLFEEIAEKSRQLETANRHKNEFLANMSHELRTPLNGIIGFSEVMLERMFGEINDKQEEYLGDILSSGRHLLSLINDILDLSKIEAGKMELDLTDFDAPAAIDTAIMLIRERATRRGQVLERAVDSALGQIRADERKFKQVLLNLLSNAVKFTPEGGQIAVSAGVVNEEAVVSVTDTGIGIAPEHQELVFEEFRQVGHADKKAEGTGLGLALCRKFIELHGGRISVTSELGQGSTFTFALPVGGPPASR